MVIPAEQSFWTEIVLQPYYQYQVISSIDPIDELIVDAIVRIKIDSDANSRTILHRGDVRYRNVSFIPRTESYTVNVTNMGFISIVTVNLSIIQTGEPTINPFSPELVVWRVIIPIGFMITIPLLVLYTSLVLYRKRLQKMV